MLGFLSAATDEWVVFLFLIAMFQSRVGFSLRRDGAREIGEWIDYVFQSRVGFSLRRDSRTRLERDPLEGFQSRVGFSLRRDMLLMISLLLGTPCFNPVLGFLSAATSSGSAPAGSSGFNPVLGFLSAATCIFARRRRGG